MSSTRRRNPLLSWRALLGVALSIVLLYFAFRDVDFLEVAAEIAMAQPLLFLAATFVATVVFPIRAFRWRPLLRPVARTGFRNRFAATSIGFMANNLLPARIGEFARAFALTRTEPVSLSASFGSLVVERLFDGLAMVGLMVVALTLPGFPEIGEIGGRDVGAYARFVLAVFFGLALLAGLVVLRPAASMRVVEAVAGRALPESFRRPVVDALTAFLDGLSALREPLLLMEVAAWSIALWAVNAVSFWLAFLAFDIHVPFSAALFLQGIIGLAVAVPSAPGFFGVWEYAARQGLVTLWGVEVTKAVGFAVGFHIAGFVPITLIGLYYAWRMGISWRDVETSEEVVETAVEREHGVAEGGGRNSVDLDRAGG